jgi:putative protein-disulfide isomerase
MNPIIIYCYDAWCNWCYGFSPVIQQIAGDFKDKLLFEVISGGMILPDTPKPISVMAAYFQENTKAVEAHTGIKFGADYTWHINNPDKSDWFPNSEKPAVALCIFKEYHPYQQVAFAADLQYALHYEGRDLCDDEAYRHLLEKYAIPADEFYTLLKDPAYKEKAFHEFALCKQLQVTGFPAVMMQLSETKILMLASGYTKYEELRQRIENLIEF